MSNETLSIHGLPLDFEDSNPAPRLRRAFARDNSDFAAVQFADGKWMVTIPAAVGLGRTFEDALLDANLSQRRKLVELAKYGPEGEPIWGG